MKNDLSKLRQTKPVIWKFKIKQIIYYDFQKPLYTQLAFKLSNFS